MAAESPSIVVKIQLYSIEFMSGLYLIIDLVELDFQNLEQNMKIQ